MALNERVHDRECITQCDKLGSQSPTQPGMPYVCLDSRLEKWLSCCLYHI
jgi:hypothetical protein